MFQELEKYKNLDFFAHQVVEGFVTGLHRSPFHGFSVEFAEHRLYNTGESTRNIDWKLFARTDKLFVKRYQEETNLRCQIVIDHTQSMLFPLEGMGNLRKPNKLTFSVYAAALLIELLSRQRDAFGLSLLSNQIDLQTQVRSTPLHKKHLYQLLEQEMQQNIAEPQHLPQQQTKIASALHLTAEQLHQRSLVVIFTDALMDPLEQEQLLDALRHLRHCKHEVLLFLTYDAPHELNFDYENRPTEFIDLESGKRLKIQPAEVAEHYRREMAKITDSFRQHAFQYHIDFHLADTSQGFDEVMLPFLLKRAKH